MNDEARNPRGHRDGGVTAQETAERDLARLVPPPDVPELPPTRRLLLREHLIDEIARDKPAPAATGTRQATRGARRRIAVLPALAAAVAGAIVIGIAVTDGSERSTTVSAADRDAAGNLLDRAALVAERQSEVPVRDGQYEYTETYGAYAMFTGSGDAYSVTMLPWSRTSTWKPVTGTGTMMQRGEQGSEHREEVSNADQSLGRPNYRYLQTLPTDPNRLLALLREWGATHGDNPRDQEAFTVIGDILSSHNATPALTAALFRAAAELDGVTIVRGVTDVLGRPGVAVTQNQKQGDREEWIFDPQTAEFIGERDVAVKSDGPVRKGDVLGNMAVVKRGFVDALGEVPPDDPIAPTRVVPTGPAL
jgi:hypothetical protein